MSALVIPQQNVPNVFHAREALREKGQFWTPGWLAEVMAEWVVADSPSLLFDPAVGPGTFFVAARRVGYGGAFDGFEIDRSVLDLAKDHGLSRSEISRVRLRDFMADSFTDMLPAIISNPPYLRHHRLGEDLKGRLREMSREILGFEMDGRTGLHVYFLLKCLRHLKPGGRLAFLLPADVCESVSSSAMWGRITQKFEIEAVMRFEGEACPFPKVDTNALVFLIRNVPPSGRIRWLQVLRPDPKAIRTALIAGGEVPGTVQTYQRDLREALDTGLSRVPRTVARGGTRLSALANVVRGIATGANEFFFRTSGEIADLRLDPSRFIRAIGRTRDCRCDILTTAHLDNLDEEGRPTWLLNLDATAPQALPRSLQAYLLDGERSGLHERALIRSRRPWYRMEKRTPPPILFAYLGRRDCRFILNRSGAVPLTGFLCVYPFRSSKNDVECLWRALNHPLTIENLAYVGKSYGGGAIKVEPRQLDQLSIPASVMIETGLRIPESLEQMTLMEISSERAPRASRKASAKSRAPEPPSQIRLARTKRGR